MYTDMVTSRSLLVSGGILECLPRLFQLIIHKQELFHASVLLCVFAHQEDEVLCDELAAL